MKKIFALAAVTAVGVATPAAAQQASADGTATATVVAPLSISHATADALRFGKFAAANGTVTVALNNTASGLAQLDSAATSADKFTVTGDPNRAFTITASGGTFAVGTPNAMPFTVQLAAANTTIGAAGSVAFSVGGTLTVKSTIAAGNYTTTYPVSVVYN